MNSALAPQANAITKSLIASGIAIFPGSFVSFFGITGVTVTSNTIYYATPSTVQSLDTAAIVGIVVGCGGTAILVLAGLVYWHLRKRSAAEIVPEKDQQQRASMAAEPAV